MRFRCGGPGYYGRDFVMKADLRRAPCRPLPRCGRPGLGACSATTYGTGTTPGVQTFRTSPGSSDWRRQAAHRVHRPSAGRGAAKHRRAAGSRLGPDGPDPGGELAEGSRSAGRRLQGPDSRRAGQRDSGHRQADRQRAAIEHTGGRRQQPGRFPRPPPSRTPRSSGCSPRRTRLRSTRTASRCAGT